MVSEDAHHVPYLRFGLAHGCRHPFTNDNWGA